MSTLPNYISIARIACVPLLIYFIVEGRMDLAFWGFLLAGLSDALDGYIARRFDAKSQFGAIIDPLADKVLLVGSFATLGWLAHLPLWLVGLVVARDVVLVGAGTMLRQQDPAFRIRPILASKLNTMLQIILVLVILGNGIVYSPSQNMLEGLVIATAATTVISFILYVQVFIRRLNKRPGDRNT